MALGNAVHRLNELRVGGDEDAVARHYVTAFIRDNRTVLADFAAANVPRGRWWWGIVEDLTDPDRRV